MGEQYFKGILAAYLGANFFNSPVDEWQKEDQGTVL